MNQNSVHLFMRASREPIRILAALHACQQQTIAPEAVTVVLDYGNVQTPLDLYWGAVRRGVRIERHYIPPSIHTGERVGRMYECIRQLACHSDSRWLWLVDDDVWPDMFCLEELLTAAISQQAAAVAARVIDMTPQPLPDYMPDNPWKNEPGSGPVMRSPLLSGSCLLVDRESFRACTMYSHPERFGDDLFLTAQTRFLKNGNWYNPNASALHARLGDEPETWRTEPLSFVLFRHGLDRVGMAEHKRQQLYREMGEGLE